MAFADTIRSATSSLPDVATLLEALLLNSGSAFSTSTINTTSTSYTDYTGLSVALTAVSGSKLILLGGIKASASASGTLVSMQLIEDGSTVLASYEMSGVSTRNDTNGKDMALFLPYLKTPSAGAHTYKVQWKTSTGTAYSATGYLLAFTFRDS